MSPAPPVQPGPRARTDAELHATEAETWLTWCARSPVHDAPLRGFYIHDDREFESDTWLSSGPGSLYLGQESTHGPFLGKGDGLFALSGLVGVPIGGYTTHVYYGSPGSPSSPRDRLSTSSTAAPDPVSWVPAVRRGAHATSVIAVQNADEHEDNQITVEVTSQAGWNLTAPDRLTFVLAPGRSRLVDFAFDDRWGDLGNDFVGSARVVGSRRVAVEHIVQSPDVKDGLAASSGVTGRMVSEHLSAPLVARAVAFDPTAPELSSEIGLFNTGLVDASVTMVYTGRRTPCAGQTWSQQIQLRAGATAVVDQRAGPIPTGCVASVEIESTVPLAAVVALSARAGATATYEVVAADYASTEHTVRYFSHRYNVSTAVGLTNPGQSVAHVALRMWPTTGGDEIPCPTCAVEIAPGESTVIWYPDLADVPTDTDGTLEVHSDVPILAVDVKVPLEEWRDLEASRMCTPDDGLDHPGELWVPVVASADLHNPVQRFLPSIPAIRR